MKEHVCEKCLNEGIKSELIYEDDKDPRCLICERGE